MEWAQSSQIPTFSAVQDILMHGHVYSSMRSAIIVVRTPPTVQFRNLRSFHASLKHELMMGAQYKKPCRINFSGKLNMLPFLGTRTLLH